MKTFPKFFATLFFSFLVFFVTQNSRANTINITSSINWSAITTGSGSGGQPGASDNINISNNANLTVNVSTGVCANITIGSAASAGELQFSSSGSPAITVTGTVTIAVNASGGTLQISNGTLTTNSLIATANGYLLNSIGGKIILTSPNVLGFNANNNTFHSLELRNGGTFTLGTSIVIADSLIVGAGTTLNLGSYNINAEAYVTLNTNTNVIGSGTITVSSAIAALGNSTINCPLNISNLITNVATGATLTINGVIAGTYGAITLNTPTSYTGTLVLTASNTYGYNSTIDAGTLSISKDSNLGAPGYGLVFNGGTLSILHSMTVNSGRSIQIDGSNCLINIPAGDTMICPNSITGAGNYTMQGGGMLTLSAVNNFGGVFTVSAGQLNINNSGAATGYFALDAGVVLDNTSGSPVITPIYFNNLTINGNFTFGGTNPITFSNNATITLNASPIITLNHAATLGLLGTINSPTQSITTTGTGTLAFSNADQLNSLTLGNTAFYSSSSANLSLKGSITNNGTSFNANGGTLIFNGTTLQSISGTSKCVFNNLTLSNTTGLAINSPAQVNGTLKFTSAGQISVNNTTLLLGSAATISGSGTSAYLVTGTSGKINRIFPSAGTFIYPVGDNAASTDYTPMSVHMVSATFPDTVSVYCSNSKDPNNLSTTNYLNRYWILSQSQLGAFSSTLQGTYLITEVIGTEAQVSTGFWNGSVWKSYGLVDAVHHQVNATVTSFGDVTGLNFPTISVAEGLGCAVNANISGGTSPFTYLWSNSATTSSVSLTTSGSYLVSVTDAAGLSATASTTFTIISTTASALSNVICNGGSNGNAKATVSGGLSPYTYSWSNGTSTLSASSPTGTILSAGSYTVTVTDNAGCTATASTTITQATSLTASTTVLNNVVCFGTSTGKAQANPSGGTSPYTYSWSNGTSTVSTSNPTGNVLSMGSYTVTVKDLNGCSTTASVSISQPIVLTATAGVISNISCHGGNNGNASASPSGGNSPYTYSWSNGSSTVSTNNPTGNVLSAGNFTVTIYDNNGCSTTTSVTTTQPTALTVSTNILANEPCNGGNVGNANATTGGGVSPYTYSWTNGTSTVSVTNPTGAILSAGNYTVSVQDNNGCSATALATVTQPLALGLSVTSFTNVSCNGAYSGTATAILVPDTFTASFTFQSFIQRFAVPSGISSVIITVAGGQGGDAYYRGGGGGGGAVFTGICSVASGHVLSVVTGGAGGGGNGGWGGSGGGGTYVYDSNTITPFAIAAGGGGSGLNYVGASAGIDLINNTTTNSPDGNGAGGTGGNGGSAGSIIDGYGNGTGGAGWISNGANGSGIAHSNGGNDRANGFGGGSGYTGNGGYGGGGGGAAGSGGGGYNGGGGGHDQFISSGGGGGGSYLNGTVLGAPTNGQTGNGYATIKYTLPGGTAPYTYSWTPSGGTNLTASGLSAGTYTLTLTDAVGCSATTSVTISQPVALSATASVVQNVACNGNNTGRATVSASFGTSPYTYSWTNASLTQVSTNSNTGTILSAGNYTVTVTDYCGASVTQPVTITQPSALADAAPMLNSNITCNGGNNGSATAAIPTGGISPYTYQWNGGTTSTNTTNTALSANTYTVNITDANGCKVNSSGTITITQPTALSVTASVLNNVLCNNSSNGNSMANPTGGTGTYTYSWINSSSVQVSTSNPTGSILGVGSYTVSVTDSCGGIATASITITQTTSPLTDAAPVLNSNVSCNGGSNGSAIASIPVGGTPPYTYQWNGGPANTNDTTFSLQAGTYVVTVTDINGCSANSSGSVTINQPAMLAVNASVLQNVACYGNNTGNAMVNITGGTSPFTFSWTDNSMVQVSTSSSTGSILVSGNYTVTVSDNCGASATSAITIVQPAFPLADSAPILISNIQCFGGYADANASVATGGTAPYDYYWNGILSGINDSYLASGTYTVVVKDANGCTAIASGTITITQPSYLTDNAPTFNSNVSCFGGNNGSATAAIPTGGTSPYTYQWNGGSTSTNETNNTLSAGTYTVNITDANGCRTNSSGTVTIGQSALAISDGSPVLNSNVSCYGGNNGSATAAIPIGGTSPYIYQWNGGSTSTNETNNSLVAGTYAVNITDANGCTVNSSDSVTIIQPAVLSVTGTVLSNVPCGLSTTGNAMANISGGTSSYAFSWVNSGMVQVSTGNPTGPILGLGSYTVTVTDSCGASVTASVTITQTTASLVESTPILNSNITCFGANNGSATAAIPTGGTSPYTYQWNGGTPGTSNVISNLSAGIYTVTVTDLNGCSANSSGAVTIAEPPVLSEGVISSLNGCYGGYGSATAPAPSGGTSPYNYLWSGASSATTATINNLTTGTYTVTIIDANGCTASSFTNIVQPLSALGVTITPTNVLCNGSTGSATATVSGGANPFTDLVDFNNTNGGQPTGTLVASGTMLYGMSQSGGAYGLGCVFSYNTNGNVYTDLLNFDYYGNGAFPLGSLILSGDTLFGMTQAGGANGIGCVFSIQTNGSGYAKLVDFDGSNGEYPWGSLTISGTTLYGMTQLGGPYGYGGIFSVQTSGSGFTDMLDFDGVNGANPTGSLALLGTKLYGMTPSGGLYGAGEVFSLNTVGNVYADVLDFDGSNGYYASGSLTASGSTLYAMIQIGGNYGVGTIFSIDTVGNAYTDLFDFNGSDGSYPYGSLSISGTTLYGMTKRGGVNNLGCTFSFNTNGSTYNDLLDFNDTNGANPWGDVTVLGNTLYGMAASGGANSDGLVFSLNPTGYTYVWSPTGGTNKTASNLSAGTYSVTVTDASGCNATTQTTITQPATSLSLTMNAVNNIQCYGGTGNAIANPATGGVPPYTYLWLPRGGNSYVASSLGAGYYVLTVTDSNGCTATISATITQPNPLYAYISSLTEIYCTEGTGSATAGIFGGISPYSYLWSDANSQTNITATGLSAGSYTVTIKDSNGCSASTSANISLQPFIATANFSQENAVQNFTVPAGITSITVTAAGAQGGGSGLDTYYYGRGAAMIGLCPVTPGHKISVVVGGAGSYSNNYDGGGGGGGTFVFDSNTGTLLMVAGGGGGEGFSLNLQNGGTGGNGGTDIAGNMPTTSYEGCGLLVSGGNGGNRGLDLQGYAPGGGGAGWISNGDSVGGQIAGNPHGGPYACGGGQDRANHFAGGAPLVGQYNDINGGGFGGGGGGGGDGGGGGGGYNGGSGGNDDTIFALGGGGGGGGSYINGTVLYGPVTNNYGNGYVSIQYPGVALAASATVNSGATCYGESNGNATVSPIGGITPYTYEWNDAHASTTTNVTDLSAGTYSVTVIDNGGCTATASVSITQPVQFIYISAGAINNVTCNGGNNGSATVNSVGGTTPYTYSWSNGSSTVSNTQAANSLSAGGYTVTVTDSCGASHTAIVNILQPNAMRDSVVTHVNIICGGGNSGSITIGARGGTYPYHYIWSNGATSANVSSLSAGTYSVVITDASGCTNTINPITITQPTPVRDSVVSISYPLCNGGKGDASVGVNGGVAPYLFAWSPAVSTTGSASNIAPGTYTITIKDAHRCASQIIVSVTQPLAIRDSIVKSLTQNASCFGSGSGNGSATVGVKYGTSPYTYSWSPNVSSTATASGLAAGTYSVSITDAHGCSGSIATIVITQPATPLRDSVSVLSGVGCYGGNGGKISIGTRGGTPAYTYAWSNGKTGYSISGLIAGTYSVVITDNHGCNGIISGITISQPSSQLGSIIPTATCVGNKTGTVTISANGGTPAYTFAWSNGKTSTTMTVVDGTYTVKVSDSHGCSATNSVMVACPDALHEKGDDSPEQTPPVACCPTMENINLYPNPNSGQFTITGLQTDMSIEMYDYRGRKISSQAVIHNSQFVINISDEPNGIYLIRILDKDGNLVADKKVVKTQ